MNKGCFAEKSDFYQFPDERLLGEIQQELKEIRQELHEIRLALVNLGRVVGEDDGK